MTLIIHKEPFVPKLVTMGQADKVLAPDSKPKPGRVKMAEEKKLGDETGVKKIHQEPADKQGPVGTGVDGQREPDAGEDVKVGDGKEES